MSGLRFFDDMIHEQIAHQRLRDYIITKIQAAANEHRRAIAESRGRQTNSVTRASAEVAALINCLERQS